MVLKKKKDSKYAPAYDHGILPKGGQAAKHFPKEWAEFKGGLANGMSGQYPAIDNGEGPKKTIYKNEDLRYDREKLCQSHGHPDDRFQDYSVQANRESDNSYLKRLAKNSNGSHRAPPVTGGPTQVPTFGGSTIANVNLQQNAPLSPKRVVWAIDHSQSTAQPTYVLNRERNELVPAGMRQAGAVYHSNPYEAWPGRHDPRNPYYGAQGDNKLPPQSQRYDPNATYYTYHNGQYERRG